MRYWMVCGLLMGALWAQEPKSRIDFESPQHGWFVLPGADGTVELTENPNDVKAGKREADGMRVEYNLLFPYLFGVLRWQVALAGGLGRAKRGCSQREPLAGGGGS